MLFLGGGIFDKGGALFVTLCQHHFAEHAQEEDYVQELNFLQSSYKSMFWSAKSPSRNIQMII